MHNSEEFTKKTKEKEKKRLFETLAEKLKEKDEGEVRRRLYATARFALIVIISLLCGRAELPFGVYPTALALLCADARILPPIICGLIIAAITGGLPPIYLAVGASLLLIRALAMLVPKIFFSHEQTKALVPYVPLTPEYVGESSPDGIPNGAPNATAEDKRKEETTNPAHDSRESIFKGIFGEAIHIRMLCAATGGLLCGLFLLIESGFSFYSLCATLLLTLGTPILTLILGGASSLFASRNWHRLISLGALAFLSVLGAEGASLLGMPLSPAVALIITLWACSEKGVFIGLLAALVAGLAFDILYLPMLLLSAVAFCLVSAVRRGAGLVAVCGIILLWCYYIGGESGLVGVLPPMLLAIPVYMLADKYREMMTSPHRFVSDKVFGVYFAEAVTEKTKNEAVRDRLDALSDAFESMSETFYDLCDKYRRPHLLGIKKITEAGFEEHCKGCRKREVCWGGEYSRTLENMSQISAALHGKGRVDLSDLPEDFSASCIRGERIVEGVNRAIAETTEELLREKAKNIFSASCSDLTAILKDALESDPEEYECDLAAAEKVYEYLCAKGIKSSGVVVWGKRRGSVIVKGISSVSDLDGEKLLKICKDISEIVKRPLGNPTLEVGRDGNIMLLRARPEIKVHSSHISLPKSAKVDELRVDPFAAVHPCGDISESFITDNSYFYSLISDGMGSGDEAAFTAGISGMFIEKMLSAGNRADVTLRMLNNVIRSENLGFESECSATVDLLELDLMSGAAAFIKSGAAPTYIGREGTVYKVSSRTMPVGIIKDADAKINKFDTRRGDIIIMISDGCCPDSEDCPWLVDFLCSYMSANKQITQNGGDIAEELKERILAEAIRNIPDGKERDDISVSVIVIG